MKGTPGIAFLVLVKPELVSVMVRASIPFALPRLILVPPPSFPPVVVQVAVVAHAGALVDVTTTNRARRERQGRSSLRSVHGSHVRHRRRRRRRLRRPRAPLDAPVAVGSDAMTYVTAMRVMLPDGNGRVTGPFPGVAGGVTPGTAAGGRVVTALIVPRQCVIPEASDPGAGGSVPEKEDNWDGHSAAVTVRPPLDRPSCGTEGCITLNLLGKAVDPPTAGHAHHHMFSVIDVTAAPPKRPSSPRNESSGQAVAEIPFAGSLRALRMDHRVPVVPCKCRISVTVVLACVEPCPQGGADGK